ncbi:DUF6876 family protein [Cytophaga sp. FL35]|uniref:DUF6876 family protein n=1 Tax=Cytophaga sp. FL35 TaxID=1904456 RepID=UPI000C4FAC42|nr:DUF6876 family protein [Cytophaga sp. FL35]MAU70612.1 hypothetical protein [Pseudozobellia sp.]MBC7000751.1 hypothetical protein [Cytophaga sp. FL35]MBG48100.1 hypothetical protein [Pseudozobellia sp.]|tara:strand:- start:1661 stop:2041 length:381 start_codon:yes stop_codon:yes gene_type:complete
MKAKADEIMEQLSQFIGTEGFYRLPLFKTRYTDGIKYLSEVAECFWLITDASIMAKSLRTCSEFVTIDFKRLSETERMNLEYEAEVIYSDGNNNVLGKQEYLFTDFPLDELRLFFVNDTLMLPSEY